MQQLWGWPGSSQQLLVHNTHIKGCHGNLDTTASLQKRVNGLQNCNVMVWARQPYLCALITSNTLHGLNHWGTSQRKRWSTSDNSTALVDLRLSLCSGFYAPNNPLAPLSAVIMKHRGNDHSINCDATVMNWQPTHSVGLSITWYYYSYTLHSYNTQLLLIQNYMVLSSIWSGLFLQYSPVISHVARQVFHLQSIHL